MTASAGSVRSRTRPRRLGCATVLVGAGAVAALTRAVVCAGTPADSGWARAAAALSGGDAAASLAGAIEARDLVARMRASPPDWRAPGKGGRTPVRTSGTR